jgi:hypothetical protein
MKPVKLFDDYLSQHAAAQNMTREEYTAHYLSETKKSDALSDEINNAMIKIDDSMGYKDFALAVSKLLKDEYGQHNFGPFMDELKKDLKR